METLAIIKSFEISEDDVFCLSTSAERMAIDAFCFECTPEALHRGIIKAVVGTAQTDLDSKLLKNSLIVGTGVLRASIGMMQQARLRLTNVQGHR